MNHTHLSAAERDHLALDLYCAFIKASPSERLAIKRRGLTSIVMERWRRVADAAVAWQYQPASPHPAIKPERVAAPPKVQLRMNTVAVERPRNPTDGRMFCEQCDRMVTISNAATCRDKFCKVKSNG